MKRGYVKLWRKSLDAGWIKSHKLWAFWTYCLLKATHKEFDAIVGLQIVHLMPGQFISGYHVASNETGLTIREIRTLIAFLRKAGNLTIKTTNKFSIITIVKWDIYQGNSTANDTLNDKRTTNERQHTRTRSHKNKKTPEEISSEISELKKRYSDQETISKVFTTIEATRRLNRITESAKLSILKSWELHPAKSVLTGIKTYLEKGYAGQKKGEKYLLGIIRNQKIAQHQGLSDGPILREITPENLEALYEN